MNFWESAAGYNLGNLLHAFLGVKLQEKQYTKVMHESEIGEYIEQEIKKGAEYVATTPYNVPYKKFLVIMKK